MSGTLVNPDNSGNAWTLHGPRLPSVATSEAASEAAKRAWATRRARAANPPPEKVA